MRHPDPELLDDENPEWTDEVFASALPFSSLPQEVQELLRSKDRVIVQRPDSSESEEPAA